MHQCCGLSMRYYVNIQNDFGLFMKYSVYLVTKGVIFFCINVEIRQMMLLVAKRLCYAEIRILHGCIDNIFLSFKNPSSSLT